VLISHVVNDYLVPLICIFGVIGNIVNLLVLTRKRLLSSMKRMEMAVNISLVALATSDLLFCVVYLSVALIGDKASSAPGDNLFMLYCATYREPVINILLLSSTWMTVLMAVSR